MPEAVTEIHEASSTDLAATQAAEAASLGRDQGPQNTDAAAESSTAGGKPETPKSPLEAVQAALKQNEAVAAEPERKPPEPKASDSPTDEAGKDKDSTKDGATTEDKDLPFHTHPRFKQLLKERNEATEKAQRLDTLLDQVTKLDLDAGEYDSALNLASLAKRAQSTNDPELARKLIPHMSGIVSVLQQIAGEALPDDLQELVDSGSVSEEQARENARLRRENELLRREATTSRAVAERTVQQTAAERQAQLISEVDKTLSNWERQWASSDPDYAVLQPLVEARIVKTMGEKGAPKSKEDAIALAEESKAAIVKHLGGRLNQVKTTVKGPSGGNPNGSARPVPKSPLDVTRVALAGAG